MYFPKPAINENDLAIIERGETAEHSIGAGQYVSWKGKLGKATSAILQGATLDGSLFDYETDGVINSLSNKIKVKTASLTSGSTGLIENTGMADNEFILSTYASSGYFAFPRFGTNNAHWIELFAVIGGTNLQPAANVTTTITIIYLVT